MDQRLRDTCRRWRAHFIAIQLHQHMNSKDIIARLPYQHPFLFVDKISTMSSEGITGNYTFQEDSYFYQGHFKNHPITPGVLLTECMAQIGLVCLGLFLLGEEFETDEHTSSSAPQIALTSSEIQFFLPVYPGEKVTVISEKELFRFQKLKCKVKMLNDKNELVCRGTISGMLNVPKT